MENNSISYGRHDIKDLLENIKQYKKENKNKYIPKNSKQKRVYTETEIKKMLLNVRSLRDRSLFCFYYLFGCRRQEALNLKKEDVWIEDDILWAKIVSQKRQHGEHSVCVSADSIYADTIVKWLETVPEGAKVWNLSGRHALRILKTILPDGYIHRFRHTRLTKLAESGATEFQLQAWAGWTDTRPAKDYVLQSTALIKKLGQGVR